VPHERGITEICHHEPLELRTRGRNARDDDQATEITSEIETVVATCRHEMTPRVCSPKLKGAIVAPTSKSI